MRIALGLIVVVALAPGCRHASGGDAGLGDDAAVDDDAAVVSTHDANIASLPPFPSFAPWTSVANATFFVGNSYTFYNDLPNVYRELNDGVTPLRVESYTIGGYKWVDHLADIQTPSSALSQFLVTGTEEDRRWDVVVLQEQSQIPGFGAGNAEYDASIDAASMLAAAAGDDGIVLYVTWGHEHGDPPNAAIYPDFATMEGALEEGYRAVAARLTSEGRRVRLAPVGPAFARVRASVVDAGGDPDALGSDFDALYDPDGSHPSVGGTYLAACVILATITGLDPATFPDAPSLGLDPAVSAALRLVARDTLADPAWTPSAPPGP